MNLSSPNQPINSFPMDISVKISALVKDVAPDLRVLTLQANVQNSPTSSEFKLLMEEMADEIRRNYNIPDINKRPGIAATRAAYKKMGKDPNRYRPSQEQLMRRVVNGKELYFINHVVDVFNYVSLWCGHSIGAFDVDKINGETLTLGIGQAGEPYEGIGRGVLNIEGLPVYRDATGGVGTPTSDNERTKISATTTHLLVCINMYGDESTIEDIKSMTEKLLTRFCEVSDIRWSLVRSED